METQTTEIVACNILEVEVGTTGYMGGDTGHGGATYFRLKDLGSTDMRVKVVGDDKYAEEVTIEFGGDHELYTFLKALKFAVKVLNEQIKQSEQLK